LQKISGITAEEVQWIDDVRMKKIVTETAGNC
jgi:hypothetical protein